MRILGARIFSKTFGGKIRAFWTANTYKFLKKITAHAYFERPYFSKFFGRKIETYYKNLKISSNIYFGFRSHRE